MSSNPRIDINGVQEVGQISSILIRSLREINFNQVQMFWLGWAGNAVKKFITLSTEVIIPINSKVCNFCKAQRASDVIFVMALNCSIASCGQLVSLKRKIFLNALKQGLSATSIIKSLRSNACSWRSGL